MERFNGTIWKAITTTLNSRNLPIQYWQTVLPDAFHLICATMTTSTIIICLCQLFSIFGMPTYIHSGHGPSFMSRELQESLANKGLPAANLKATVLKEIVKWIGSMVQFGSPLQLS